MSENPFDPPPSMSALTMIGIAFGQAVIVAAWTFILFTLWGITP